jgi:hypothetical protein
MFGMCVYCVFVLSCVQVESLRRADHSPEEFYRPYNNHETEKSEARAQGGCRVSEKENYVTILKFVRPPCFCY